MMDYGFIKVAAAVPGVRVADCMYNVAQIEKLIQQADAQGTEILVMPELALTSYTCGDLFSQPFLLEQAERGLKQLLDVTSDMDMIVLVGMPVALHNGLADSAVVLQKGRILGVVPKTYLLNHKSSAEKRWFVPGSQITETEIELCQQWVPLGTDLLFDCGSVSFGIEIGTDLWAPIPPSSHLSQAGADLIFNLSANVETIGMYDYLKSLIEQQSARCLCGYVFASCGYGESTTDVVFGGNAFVCENGTVLADSTRFSLQEQLVVSEIDVQALRAERRQNSLFAAHPDAYQFDVTCVKCDKFVRNGLELSRQFNRYPFVPEGAKKDERCREVFSIQTSGLIKRLQHTHARTAVVGISGGLDSTLALLVCVKAFDKMQRDRKDILGITMPGFGTTDRTYNNALNLMNQLGITVREISIKEACTLHYRDIGHDMSQHDVVYENSQARERTQILMDLANQTSGMVVGTGDLSELALGWATYNGDQMSMYGVNADVPKTLVKHLVKWVAENEVDAETCAILMDIVDTPISPELIPADEQGNIKQKTEDLVGPYELHDFFLYRFIRFGDTPAKIFKLACYTFEGMHDRETIKKWLYTFFRRFFNQQFKRSSLPDGPKVGSVCLGQRGEWLMASDSCSTAWLNEIESL